MKVAQENQKILKHLSILLEIIVTAPRIIVTAPRILGATIVVIDEISLTSLEDFYNIHNKTTFHLN